MTTSPLSQQGSEKKTAAVTPLHNTVNKYKVQVYKRVFKVLTESCHSQYERDHDGDPGDPESLLPVALSLVGLQAHAALQETCKGDTQTLLLTQFFHFCSLNVMF